jgi:hypothetical protein
MYYVNKHHALTGKPEAERMHARASIRFFFFINAVKKVFGEVR